MNPEVPTATAVKAPDSPLNHKGESPAIEVRGLKKTYTSGLVFKKYYEALKDVTLTVNRGEIFGLLGANGAGKTTFLKIILGIIRKSGGEAMLLGHQAGSRDSRQRVGYLPEHLRVPRHLTGYQALEFFGNLSNVPTSVVRQKRGELLETVGLAERAKDNVKQYSKGMLQRLGLAQALLHDPELLVLDEPTDGLDPHARAEMRQVIRDLQKRGVTVFLNSHLLAELEMICHRVAILDKGNLRYCGDVADVGKALQSNKFGEGGEQAISAQLEVAGDEATVRGCLKDRAEIVENRGLVFTVRASVADQAALDALVDHLRSHGLSLIALEPTKLTLEDAFLQIVDESSFRN